ncbi:MAG: hypothetical protein ABSF97_21785 [Candidatus Sulfotelmatobacter sp.]|jgi:hypothetical protein
MADPTTRAENNDDFSPIANPVETLYLAYCDILGFSNRILNDFDKTLETYRSFGDLLGGANFKNVRTTIYSDAILITTASLKDILIAVQSVWFFALSNDFMLRGAITKGRYWEQRRGHDLLVVSDALVHAVKLEKMVGVPAVAIADDVEIPDIYWLARFQGGPFATPLLHFRDRNIVNPFNIMWGQSAKDRASLMLVENPAHKDKYLWFLALHDAIVNGKELIPPDVLKRFFEKGMLKFTPGRLLDSGT